MVAILALYIIAAPYLPQFGWWLKHDSPVRTLVKRPDPQTITPVEPVIKGDMLLIPRLDMEEPIHGGGIGSLKQGVWKLPHSSAPDKGGNTVLVGHRFTYSGQAVFYHLDKVRKDDPITLHWQGKAYKYKISDIKIVLPTALEVEAPTKEPQLTIYTCTPLWSVSHRLVIVAKPIEAKEPS